MLFRVDNSWTTCCPNVVSCGQHLDNMLSKCCFCVVLCCFLLFRVNNSWTTCCFGWTTLGQHVVSCGQHVVQLLFRVDNIWTTCCPNVVSCGQHVVQLLSKCCSGVVQCCSSLALRIPHHQWRYPNQKSAFWTFQWACNILCKLTASVSNTINTNDRNSQCSVLMLGTKLCANHAIYVVQLWRGPCQS